MKITKIEVQPFEDTETFHIAWVNIELDGMIALKSIKLFKRDDGPYFLSYPTIIGQNNFQLAFFPTTVEFREELEKAAVAQYHKALETMEEMILQGS